ncbi:hypothetical protein J4Q44_G00109530, partial [Coregonus suidteri]
LAQGAHTPPEWSRRDPPRTRQGASVDGYAIPNNTIKDCFPHWEPRAARESLACLDKWGRNILEQHYVEGHRDNGPPQQRPTKTTENVLVSTVLSHRCNSLTDSVKVESHASSETWICSEASSTAMQCLRPLHHSGGRQRIAF